MRVALLVCFLLVIAAGASNSDTTKAQRISASGKVSNGSRALLVGINSYPKNPLFGTVNDALAWKEVLIERYGFMPEHITTLLDKQATRSNILKEMRSLMGKTAPGDTVFFFFSGHGTSSYDSNLRLDMGPATGALVPVDIKMSGSKKQILDSLIIGRRDLRPILEQLDRDRNVIVVVDACFSGNSVRGFPSDMPRGRKKALPLPVLQPDSSAKSVTTNKSDSTEPYPYRNVLYISASSDREPATDKNSDPYDGKPHGALTGAMLRGMRGDADSNNDGIISYDELYRFARNDAQTSKQTPQLLKSDFFDTNRRIFNASPKLTKKHSNAFSPKSDMRVKLGEGAARLSAGLNGLTHMKLTDGDYDILITADNNEYQFVLANGDLLCRVSGEAEAQRRLERYLKVRELVALTNPSSTFNAWLTVGKDAGKSVFYEKENISFSIKSEQDASILLLDIDPQGYISVLMPDSAASDTKVMRGVERDLGNASEVSGPFGVESLKLFAFKKAVNGLLKFAGRSPIDPSSDEFVELEHVIRENTGKNGDWTAATVEVVTVPSSTSYKTSQAETPDFFKGLRGIPHAPR